MRAVLLLVPLLACASRGPEATWAADATTPRSEWKKPPCRGVEAEHDGAYWIGTEHKPPCPEGIYEVAERCVVPVQAAARVPTGSGE